MDMRSLLTLSVLLALIREDKGEKPTVSLLPWFSDVFVGDDVTLICKGGGEQQIKWFINGDPQSHQGSSMLLTAVTSKDNGTYECERGGSKSDPYTLTVVELEPYAQLSPSIGGAVMSKGGGRNLVLHVDDDVYGWKCFVLRGESGFVLKPDVRNKMMAVIYAELKEAKRATFWCKNGTQRSNAVTLKMTELKVMLEPPAAPAWLGESVALRCAVWGGKAEKARFYKDNKSIVEIKNDTYIITNATQADAGQYRCHATYRYSHISADAAQQEGDSDAQELKVIGGPPATTVDSTSPNRLECFCSDCPAVCTSYYWYHTLPNHPRQRLPENTHIITVKEGGLYSCRRVCGKGFSRFSNVYSYTAQPESVNVLVIIMAVILMVLGVLIVVLIALKRRKHRGFSFQVMERWTSGDFDQIQFTSLPHAGQGQG